MGHETLARARKAETLKLGFLLRSGPERFGSLLLRSLKYEIIMTNVYTRARARAREIYSNMNRRVA